MSVQFKTVGDTFGGEVDSEGRIVIRMGGDCPNCGAKANVKYARDGGHLVLYHTPASCLSHAMAYRRDQARRDDDEFVMPTPYPEDS